MATKIISFINHKGGVGKTTSVLNVGASLVKHFNKKVLLIDIDPQANLSTSLGFNDSAELSLYTALIGEIEALPVSETKEGIDIVISSLDLVKAEKELMSEVGSEHVLSELIEPIKDRYDYILIDCPPSLGVLTFNAMVASTDVFIVVQAHFLALRGVAQLLFTIDKIKKRVNKNLALSGVIITQYQKNLNLSREVEAVINENFDEKVFNSKIRVNIALAESVSDSRSIYSWDENSNGAKDYKALTNEIIERFKN